MNPQYADTNSHVQHIFEQALQAATPDRLIRQRLSRSENHLHFPGYTYPLHRGRIYLLAVGKAAWPMYDAAMAVLEDVVNGGVVVSKLEQPAEMPVHFRYFQAGHPIPNESSVAAAQTITSLLNDTKPDDLLICLISGGASALLTNPIVALDDWKALNQALLAAGCPIGDVNTVRQQLDPIKGGGLARLAAPASVVSLILSDVIGNNLAHIGSGLTVPQPVRASVVRRVLEKYNVLSLLPDDTRDTILACLEQGTGPLADPRQVFNTIIGDVGLAAEAAARAAAGLGFTPAVLTTFLEGEAREVGKFAAALARGGKAGQCLILGGETTVTLLGEGRGGRNQEVALAAALSLHGATRRTVASFATDAEDGMTPVAGAMVTGETVARGLAQGLNAGTFLANNDSFTYFDRLGGSHLRAAQSTNVNDLILILAYE